MQHKFTTIFSLLSLFFLFSLLAHVTSRNAYAVSLVTGVTPPSGLACQGAWSSHDWSSQSNSREYPKYTSSVCSGKDPNNPGSCNFNAWPQLWTTPAKTEGCVISWCSGSTMYVYNKWNPGYIDGTADKNYTLYIDNVTTGAVTKIPVGSATNAVLNFGSTSTAGQSIFEQIINGWTEWGSPGTGYKLTCSQPASVSPSVSPVTSPTQASTNINLAVKLPGIGTGGNLSPHHTTRTAHITFYNASDDPTEPNVTPVMDMNNVTLTYDPNSGFFQNASIPVQSTLATGDYQMFVKIPGYLRKAVLGKNSSNNTVTITAGTSNLLPSITMISGDVAASYNVMGTSDFYALVGCYKDKVNSSTCSIGAQMADINDDGVVDGIDVNYWLLGYQAAQANASEPSVDIPGDGPPGR